MDHDEAVRLQAAVKYVLGELPQAERDSFEEHYFDCRECGMDVKAAAAFVENGRQVLRAEAVEVAAGRKAESKGGWLFWLRPAFAAPALLVLLAVIGYQNLITFPKIKSEAPAARAQVFNSFSLVGTNVRGGGSEEAVKVQVQKNETLALDFDFLPTRPFDHYMCQLQDEAGRVVLQTGIPAEKANREVHLLVPNGLERPGKYRVLVAGDPGTKASWVAANEVSRLNFVVDFHP